MTPICEALLRGYIDQALRECDGNLWSTVRDLLPVTTIVGIVKEHCDLDELSDADSGTYISPIQTIAVSVWDSALEQATRRW